MYSTDFQCFSYFFQQIQTENPRAGRSRGTTKERVVYSPEKKKVNLKLTYGTLFKSRPFLTVTIAGLVISGLLQFGSFNQYLTKNYFGNSDLSIWLTISNYAPMVLLILFCPRLAAKFGKKELCTAGLVLSTLSSLVMCFIGPNEYLQATLSKPYDRDRDESHPLPHK